MPTAVSAPVCLPLMCLLDQQFAGGLVWRHACHMEWHETRTTEIQDNRCRRHAGFGTRVAVFRAGARVFVRQNRHLSRAVHDIGLWLAACVATRIRTSASAALWN